MLEMIGSFDMDSPEAMDEVTKELELRGTSLDQVCRHFAKHTCWSAGRLALIESFVLG